MSPKGGEWFPAREILLCLLRTLELVGGEVAEPDRTERADCAVNRAPADVPEMADAGNRKELRQSREQAEHRGKNILHLKSPLSESLFDSRAVPPREVKHSEHGPRSN
jgi:hypothetical protein